MRGEKALPDIKNENVSDLIYRERKQVFDKKSTGLCNGRQGDQEEEGQKLHLHRRCSFFFSFAVVLVIVGGIVSFLGGFR